MNETDFIKKGRLAVIILLTLVFSALIFIQYARLAFSKSSSIARTSHSVQRGSIFDRNGKQLAVSTNFYHMGVTPSLIDDAEEFSKLCAPLLQLEPEKIADIITNTSSQAFVYIKKKIDQDTYEKLEALTDKNGYGAYVRYDRIPGRIYPENTLASQLIGFMGDDGTGLSGIEYSMQDTLSPPANPDDPDETQGKNIYLTIDGNLQYKLEKIAQEAFTSTQAESLMLVAAEVKTGKILSYISLPSPNLNEYTKASLAQMMDRPASESYEPGSVFKIFSIAAFIDTGSISEDELFYCDGIYERRTATGERIRITCLGNHGWITAREALKFSCNDALAQMSDKIESEAFLKKIREQGFGSRTGVELPGETSGTVRNTNDRYWSARSKATIAIGQEITVSALQMVQAATAIANSGFPVRLTFIDKITSHDGTEEYKHVPEYKAQVLKKSTADYILSCMETVAQSGTGWRASLGDISIGVKTGTAQMADTEHGGYSETDFLSNCIAIFPIEDPEIILYIVIEKAKGETYAGRIVAPVIGQTASVIIDHIGMSRGSAASLAHSGLISITSDGPLVINESLPDFTGVPKRSLLQLLGRSDINVKINGNGWVKSQNPAPGTPVTENMEIELFLE